MSGNYVQLLSTTQLNFCAPVWNRLEPSGYVRFPSGTVWLRPLPVWLRPLVVNLISRQQKPLLADFYFLRPAVMPCLNHCFFGIGI
jgi:hypothetical protein